MKQSQTVYIVMPAYNVASFIGQAFESLLAQTYPHWICLCVNDGSTDDTWAVMRRYAARDSRIRVFSQKNQGVTRARNFLLSKVRGPYLTFMDADDYLHPQTLATMIGLLRRHRADAAEYTAARFTDTVPPAFLQPITDFHTDVVADMARFYDHTTSTGQWINVTNKVYRWSSVKSVRFRPELSYEDDYFYNSEAHLFLRRKVITDAPFYFYRKNPNSLCGHVNWDRYQTAAINRIRLSFDRFIATPCLPDSVMPAFRRDLSRDAFRMIVRKPLKKGGSLRPILFERARRAMHDYLGLGAVRSTDLGLSQRILVKLVLSGWKSAALLWVKLT